MLAAILFVIVAEPRQAAARLGDDMSRGGEAPGVGASSRSMDIEYVREQLGMREALDYLKVIASWEGNWVEKLRSDTLQSLESSMKESPLGKLTGTSFLHIAVIYDNAKAIEVLAAAGLDLEVVQMSTGIGTSTSSTFTPLQLAAGLGCTEALRALIAAGAPLDTAGTDGSTAMHTAAYKGEEPSIAALIEAGASLSAQDEDGYSPLHVAAAEGHAKAIKALVHAGASLEARNHAGHTPMHDAARNGNVEAIRALAEAGASLTTYNSDFDTPKSLAELNGHKEEL